jgi:hypothetical protein
MRTIAVLLLAATLGACATTSSDAPPSAAPVEGDEFQIRATVLAVYNVLSGPAGRRDWDRFEALFAPGASIVTVDANGVPSSAAPKEYATAMTPKFNAAPWFQRPVDTRVQLDGNVAQVRSAYELRDAANQEQPTARGTASFALVRIGAEWKVESVIWQSVAR